MSMQKMSAEQAGAVLEDAYLRGLTTKLAHRNYPPQNIDQLHKAAQTAANLNQGIQSGQIKVSRDNDIFSAGLAATAAINLPSNDVEAANKAASLLLQDESFLTAGLMAAQAELEADPATT